MVVDGLVSSLKIPTHSYYAMEVGIQIYITHRAGKWSLKLDLGQ